MELEKRKREEEARASAIDKIREAYQDNYDPTKGAKMSFTFEEGLIVQVLPSGDVSQSYVNGPSEKKKFGGSLQDIKPPNVLEKSRLITRNGQVIRYFLDGNT